MYRDEDKTWAIDKIVYPLELDRLYSKVKPEQVTVVWILDAFSKN